MKSKENIMGAYLFMEMNTYCYIVFGSWFFMCDLPILWIILPSANLYASESSLATFSSYVSRDSKIMLTINLCQT